MDKLARQVQKRFLTRRFVAVSARAVIAFVVNRVYSYKVANLANLALCDASCGTTVKVRVAALAFPVAFFKP